MSTTSQRAERIASTAAPTMNSNEEPPSIVEETHAGCMPQYSAIAVALKRSTPVVARPSTSETRNPASPSAVRAAWVWSW